MDSGLRRNDGFIGYLQEKKYFAKVSGRLNAKKACVIQAFWVFIVD